MTSNRDGKVDRARRFELGEGEGEHVLVVNDVLDELRDDHIARRMFNSILTKLWKRINKQFMENGKIGEFHTCW